MAEPLRHRQTKEAATDMFYLTPPRHISTLPISTKTAGPPQVRFTPVCDRAADIAVGPVRAKPGSGRSYSITSSARASSSGGIVRPIAFAALRLITKLVSRPLDKGVRYRLPQCVHLGFQILIRHDQRRHGSTGVATAGRDGFVGCYFQPVGFGLWFCWHTALAR
jgi:hypothetical protein